MTKSMKKMLLLAKVETTTGTDATPTAAANAILARGITPTPISADAVSRQLIRPYKGNPGSLSAGVHCQFEFEVELAGSGTPGTAPAWAPLLRACGFAETVTPPDPGESVVGDVEYTLVSEGEPTLTLYCILDGVQFKMTGAKGTVSFELNAKAIPVMKYRFIGAYHPPTDVAMPGGVDYSAFKMPQTVGQLTTPTFTFHGLSACTSAFSVDVANALNWRELINCAGASSPDRTPAGSVTMDFPSVAVKNWAEIVREGTTGAATIVHGTTVGNVVELQMPSVQCKPFSLQDDNGTAMVSMPFDINPIHGDDELVVIVR